MELEDHLHLPVSDYDFACLISEKTLYVDKTDLAADLARLHGPFFLSRPRRFGKSMLLSTFKELFKNGKGRFKGLKLEAKRPWTDHTYKVIHLDLSNFADIPSHSVEQELVNRLMTAFAVAGVSFNVTIDWKHALNLFLAGWEERSLVLLIDEYDKPFVHFLNKADEFERRRRLFSQFYQIIEGNSEKLRFLFITGVCGFTSLGIFGKETKITDISFEPDYGAIAGFMQEELEQYFKPYFAHAARKYNKWRRQDEEPWNKQTVREGLRTNYFGFTFDLQARHKVCNPFEIVRFFDSPEEGFEPIWLRSAGCETLITLFKYTFAPRDDLKPLMERLVKGDVCCTLEDLSPQGTNLSQPDFPLLALLYQTGYVTIKKADGDVLYVGIPNGEVRKAYDDDDD